MVCPPAASAMTGRCQEIGQCGCVPISYEWRGAFANAEVKALHAEGFDHGRARGVRLGGTA